MKENNNRNFTYTYYKEFLRQLSEAYCFTTFQEGKEIVGARSFPLVIMRHDVDMDLEAAVMISSLEERLGIRSTYFFMVCNPLYNVFSARGSEQVSKILMAGHHLGLHFDCAVYPSITLENLIYYVSRECELLESYFGSVEAVTFHRKSPFELSGVDLGKWPHPHEYIFQDRFKYYADSRGNWLYGNPLDSEAFRNRENLQILTHPIWWAEETTPPYERLVSLVEQIGQRIKCYIAENCQAWKEVGK